MRPLNEIIVEHIDDKDVFDESGAVDAVLAAATLAGKQFDPDSYTLMLEVYMELSINYLGELVLTIADEVGALPEGVPTEKENIRTALKINKVSALYKVLSQ